MLGQNYSSSSIFHMCACFGVCLCVSVHACICVSLCVCVRMCAHVQEEHVVAVNWCLVSFSLALLFFSFRQGCHWSWSSLIQLYRLDSQTQGPSQHSLCVLLCLAFGVDSGDPNSSPHAHAEETLLTEPSLQPLFSPSAIQAPLFAQMCEGLCNFILHVQSHNNHHNHHCSINVNGLPCAVAF